jgi:hypothetical protein
MNHHHYLSFALCAAGLLGALTACSGSKTYTIEGSLTDLDNFNQLPQEFHNVSIVSFDSDTLAHATIDGEGKFTITGTIDQPTLAVLALGEENMVTLVVEPGTIQVVIGEVSSVTGTEQNDALNEFATLTDDLEQYYVAKLYSTPVDEESDEDGDGISDSKAQLFNETITSYFHDVNALTDSIYNANYDNEVGLFMALTQIQSMSSSAEVKTKFGDNDHVMQSKLVQHLMEMLDAPADDFDEEGFEATEDSTEWEADDDADER